jgi:hypothetical protein
MNINIQFDASADNAPAGFKPAVLAAVQLLDAQFTAPVTVTIAVGYGEVQGQSLGGALGESIESLTYVTYSQLQGVLPAGLLPANDPTNGAQLVVTTAEAAALGLPGGGGGVDGYVGFSSTYPFTYDPANRAVSDKFDLIGVVEHEITEVLGRISMIGSNAYSLMDLFRYSASGVHSLSANQTAYFSVDGGHTNLDNYNTNPNQGDLGDWAASAGNDAFLAACPPGVELALSSADITLIDTLGYGGSHAPTVTVQEIQSDYLAIVRTGLPLDQATAVVNSISAGSQSEAQYVNGLLAQVADTTIPAVAVEASMYGVVGTSAEVTSLATQFLPGQVNNATSHGLNPAVYACEALGLAFAFGNETGSTAFASGFGPATANMPNSTAGDAAFAAAASTAIFGTASTPTLVNAIEAWVATWKTFYSNHAIPGMASPTAVQIDLAARAAAWGDAVGVALANNLGLLDGQAVSFLEDAAQGSALYAAPLSSQPAAQPFQGASVATSEVQLTGVAASPDHTITWHRDA